MDDDGAGLVIALPAAGGGSGMFAALRAALPPGVSVVVPDLPGRGRRMRQPPEQTVAGLVADIVEELTPRLTAAPYAVFASCFGTIIGLELVWRLIDRGLPRPRALLVSGRQPPETAPPFEQLERRSDEEILDQLRQTWPSEHAWDELPGQLRALMLRRIRLDNRLGSEYVHVPRGPVPVPLVAYHGVDDPELAAADIRLWARHTSESFVVRLVPGDHYFYLGHVDELAEELTNLLR